MATSPHRRAAARLAWVGLVLLWVATGSAPAADVSNDDCLACHSDKTMTTRRGGRTVSLFVDNKKFSGSVHGALSCTNCHADLQGKDLPHEPGVAPVQCGACHSDEQKQHAA